LFDVSRQRVKLAAEVDLPAELPATKLGRRQCARMERAARMLMHAAHQAWTQSGWEPGESLPVVLGTTSGGMELGEAFYRQAIQQPFQTRHQAARSIHYQAQRQGLDLQSAFDFGGPIIVIANACASGANAIGHAWDLIHHGQAERVLAGGYDGLNQLVFCGFDSLQALSPTRCRPFDAQRDGLALGEGAAVLTLESLAAAKQRGAEIIGEIIGYSAATDAHHLTQPHPHGAAAFQAMTQACASAAISPAAIGYVNAHGTGTPLNDSSEAAAINRWAGTTAGQLRVSSTKGSIGHLLGAAGAVEAVVCVMALREGWLPPNAGLETVDPVCRFPVLDRPLDLSVEYAASNSFGFGGANATLLFRRWP
jgi:3-oxoacyl-[acyl-carrier-protein] synthase II